MDRDDGQRVMGILEALGHMDWQTSRCDFSVPCFAFVRLGNHHVILVGSCRFFMVCLVMFFQGI